jgi:hypothetical protein
MVDFKHAGRGSKPRRRTAILLGDGTMVDIESIYVGQRVATDGGVSNSVDGQSAAVDPSATEVDPETWRLVTITAGDWHVQTLQNEYHDSTKAVHLHEDSNYSYFTSLTRTTAENGTVAVSGSGSGTGTASGDRSGDYYSNEYMGPGQHLTAQSQDDYDYSGGWTQSYSDGAVTGDTTGSSTLSGWHYHSVLPDYPNLTSTSYSEQTNSPGFGTLAVSSSLPSLSFSTGGSPTLGYDAVPPNSTPVGSAPSVGVQPPASVPPAPPVGVPVCFVAGTRVLMADGTSKAIEEVKAGEMVLAASDQDPEGPVKPCRVVETYRHAARPIMEVRIAGNTIRCTLAHPFYVKGRSWTAAEDLRPGDVLRTNGEADAKCESAGALAEEAPVFNLHVELKHTYFVALPESELSVLVHNDSGLPTPDRYSDHNRSHERWQAYWNQRQQQYFDKYGRNFEANERFKAEKDVFDHDYQTHQNQVMAGYTGPPQVQGAMAAVPVVGPAMQAQLDWQAGNYVLAGANTVNAMTDLTGVKAFGKGLWKLGAAALSKVMARDAAEQAAKAEGRVGVANAVKEASTSVPKMPVVPTLEGGRNVTSVGRDIIKWGTGADEAASVAKNMTADRAKEILSQVSAEEILKIRDWYRSVAEHLKRHNPDALTNAPTPIHRAELMEMILKLGQQ